MKIVAISVLLVFILVFLFSFNSVSAAEEGFAYKWSYELEKDASSISAADFDRDRIMGDMLVGSLDNNVYAFDTNGTLLGYYVTRSSVMSVSAFSHGGDNRMNDGVAGSLDNKVYAFWRPYGRQYFYTDPDNPDTPKGLWWSYDAGDNIYSVASVDLDGTGQRDSIVVGTGSYYSTSPGKVIALNGTGSLLWSISTSSAVNVITSADLDSDTKLTHVVVGYGNTLIVMDSNGKTIWTRGFSGEVTAASPADFDRDEELDDVIVGAGNKVYALSSKNRILWTQEFNATIISIYPIDLDKDRIYDYYQVASGRTVYAVNNGEEHQILWEYDTGHNITSLTAIDMEKDGVPDDIAFVSGNMVYAYTHEILKMPNITAKKILSSRAVNAGEEFGIELVINNSGDANASDIIISDSIPDNFTVVSGNLSWGLDSLSPGDTFRMSYIVRAEAAGNYTLPEATGEYIDPYYPHSATHRFRSSSISVNVSPDVSLSFVEVKLTPPKIVFLTSGPEEVGEGENFTINFTIINEGGSGTNVTFNAQFPEDFVPVDVTVDGAGAQGYRQGYGNESKNGSRNEGGNGSKNDYGSENRDNGTVVWQGEVGANESKVIRYTLNPQWKILRLKNKQYNISNFNVTYTARGETVHLNPDQVGLTLTVSLKKRISVLLAVLMSAAAAFFAVSRTRKGGRSATGKRAGKGRGRAGKSKSGEAIERDILRLYLEHKKRGKKLTYSIIKKRLKADKGDIQRAVNRLKAEGKM